MKDIIAKKIMAIIGCSCLLLFLFTCAVKLCIQRELDLRTTYVAARDIPPRTQLQDTDLLKIELPNDYVLEHTFTSREEIVGKYTEIQGMIPAGSVFYKSMLYEATSLPDQPTALLKEGQTAYTLSTDLSRMGGALVSGQRVDLYLSLDRKEDTPLSDCIFENVRILSIKDHKGIEIDDPNSTGSPAFIVLAIPKDQVALLNVAEEVGSVRLFATSASYDIDNEATLNINSSLMKYLKNKA